MPERRRAAVRTIVPDRLFQRGQIFTWTREAKARMFATHAIRSVVNLWPKVDPDLGDAGLDWIWQISCPRSEDTLLPHVEGAARAVADYLRAPGTSTLVLCEAGRTRSVFFCCLVGHHLFGETYANARTRVCAAVPDAELKAFHLAALRERDEIRLTKNHP
jgi:hypothetical protein